MPENRYLSEGPVDYDRYRFSYCHWLETNAEAVPEGAYEKGFLPFSGDLDDSVNRFYMARSLRVSLSELRVDKKRRYDQRKWDAFGLTRRLLSKGRFLEQEGPHARKLALEWTRQRFGEPWLNADRLAHILHKPFLRDVLVWDQGDRMAAFALIVRGGFGAHYWFVFYNPAAGKNSLPGHGYLLDFLHWADTENLSHAYLGTAYGKGSAYKSRGLAGIEFWDGNGWSRDKGRLRMLQNGDETAQGTSA